MPEINAAPSPIQEADPAHAGARPPFERTRRLETRGGAVRLARRLNPVLGRTGKLFAERYHARTLRSPREVRNVIRYVLLNARHHAAERGERLSRYWIDPASSAAWFDGWRQRIRADEPWVHELLARPRPTALARTWLLNVGWRRAGLLDFDEVPGPSAGRRGSPSQ